MCKIHFQTKKSCKRGALINRAYKWLAHHPWILQSGFEAPQQHNIVFSAKSPRISTRYTISYSFMFGFMPLSFLTKYSSIVLKWNELIFCYYTRRTLIDRNHLYAIYILPISKFLSASLLYGFLDKTMEKISLGMMVTYCDIHSPRAKVLLIKCCGGLFFMKQNLKFGLVWTYISWVSFTFYNYFG